MVFVDMYFSLEMWTTLADVIVGKKAPVETNRFMHI